MYQPADAGFASYFLSMLSDADRNDAYERAIEACIGDFEAAEGRAPRVLDLGCGTGLLTAYCLKHGAASVVAVDTNQTMVNLCRRALGKEKRATIFPGTVDDYADSLDEEPTFDVVVTETLGTLHTSENMPEYLAAAARYLEVFENDRVYVVPRAARTLCRAAVARPRGDSAVDDYRMKLLYHMTSAPAWTPTNELGLLLFDSGPGASVVVDGGSAVELRRDDFSTLDGDGRFPEKACCRVATPLDWPAVGDDEPAVCLAVLEFECELWGDVVLSNTMRSLGACLAARGPAVACGKYDAWGFFVAGCDRGASASLKAYSRNGVPRVALGRLEVRGEINDVSPRHAQEMRALAGSLGDLGGDVAGKRVLCDQCAGRALLLNDGDSVAEAVALYEPDAALRAIAEEADPDLFAFSTSRNLAGALDDAGGPLDVVVVADFLLARELLFSQSF